MNKNDLLEYHCSQEDQINAAKLYSSRRRLARDCPTRICVVAAWRWRSVQYNSRNIINMVSTLITPFINRSPARIYCTIYSGYHCIAVQITISPIQVSQFLGQSVFCPRFQYRVCHAEILTDDTHSKVCQTVESLVGAYFRVGEWEVTDDDW